MNQLDLEALRDRKEAEAAALERPQASRIGDDVNTFVADLQRMVAALPNIADSPPASQAACPALLADEVECDGGGHLIRSREAERIPWYRQCGLHLYRSQKTEHAELIADCLKGVAPTEPIGDALRQALRSERPVARLPEMLATLDRVRARGFRGQHGHVGFTGSRGTAKTHALLCLHFSALWQGVVSRWVNTAMLVEIAVGRSSYDGYERGRAEGELRALRRAQILCLDDLADRLTDQRAKDPGVTAVAGVLLDLLNGFGGRVFLSSNLWCARPANPTEEEKRAMLLSDHPDIGPRVVSRLLADHRGVPAMGVRLSGADQRRHSARNTFLERTQTDA